MDPSVDTQNMIGVIRSSHEQVADALRAAGDITVSKDVNKIVFFGMGGSANPGKVLRDYVSLDIPILGNNNYDVPSCVDADTLAIVTTYSGGTEETLSAFMKLKEITKHIVCIGSGGRLQQFAEKYGFPFAKVGDLPMPRLALYSMILTPLRILENSGLVEDQSAVYDDCVAVLKDFEARDEESIGIAESLKDKKVVICTEDKFFGVGYIWRISCNENSKVFAANFDFPEITHNSISMWVRENKDLGVLFVLDSSYNSRVVTSMKDTAAWIVDKVGCVHVLTTVGQTKLGRMFSSCQMASFVSYYLSLAYGDDPTPVDMQDESHQRLRDLDGDIREGME